MQGSPTSTYSDDYDFVGHFPNQAFVLDDLHRRWAGVTCSLWVGVCGSIAGHGCGLIGGSIKIVFRVE